MRYIFNIFHYLGNIESTRGPNSGNLNSLNSSFNNGVSFIPSNSYKSLQRTNVGLKTGMGDNTESINYMQYRKNELQKVSSLNGKENIDPRRQDSFQNDVDENDELTNELVKKNDSIHQNMANSVHYVKKSMKSLRK